MPISKKKRTIGKVQAVENGFAQVLLQTGQTLWAKSLEHSLACFDWVEVSEQGGANLLSKSSTSDGFYAQKRLKTLQLRNQLEALTCQFFESQGFLQVRTPIVVENPGMEAHIRPFYVRTLHSQGYLQTSPEFAMKELLAQGMSQIFQISPCFRDEPASLTHLPEYLMIEWYRSFEPLEVILQDTQELIQHLVLELKSKPAFIFQGKTISTQADFERIAVSDIFSRACKTSLFLPEATLEELLALVQQFRLPVPPNYCWQDLFFILWLNIVEPTFPQDRFFFLTEYPEQLGANATTRPVKSKIPLSPGKHPPVVANRFELQCGNLELANAFEELTDPAIQRSRFEDEMSIRSHTYPDFPLTPLPERFLKALHHMPPASGIALGLDRLIMLLADVPEISYTTWYQTQLLSSKGL